MAEKKTTRQNPTAGTKKELEVVQIQDTALYGLRFKHGGELPAHLNGAMWTSAQLAEQARDEYYAQRG